MLLNELRLAQSEIYRDFEADVPAKLLQHDAKMHECTAAQVKCKLDGTAT
jgi:hypothetical protein